MTDTASNRTATVPYRVRFDECAADGLARTSALLRYAQDVAWIHSERLGFDRDWYAARGLTWLVRAARVVVLRAVPLGTTLDVSTTVDGFRKVWARRRTEGASPTARSRSGPTPTGSSSMPAACRPACRPSSPPSTASCPAPFEPGRVALPPTPAGAAVHRGLVRPQDVDPLGHVNNAAYLDYLEEALLDGGPAAAAAVAAIPRTVRIEYLFQAVPGTVVTGSTWRDEPATGASRWAWRLTDDDGADLARGTLDGRGGTPDSPTRPGSRQERSMTRTVFRGGSVFDGTGVGSTAGRRRRGGRPDRRRRQRPGRRRRRRHRRQDAAARACSTATCTSPRATSTCGASSTRRSPTSSTRRRGTSRRRSGRA